MDKYEVLSSRLVFKTFYGPQSATRSSLKIKKEQREEMTEMSK
jgi:hypothetical protein